MVNLISEFIVVDVVMDGVLIVEIVGNSYGIFYILVLVGSVLVIVNEIDGMLYLF